MWSRQNNINRWLFLLLIPAWFGCQQSTNWTTQDGDRDSCSPWNSPKLLELLEDISVSPNKTENETSENSMGCLIVHQTGGASIARLATLSKDGEIRIWNDGAFISESLSLTGLNATQGSYRFQYYGFNTPIAQLQAKLNVQVDDDLYQAVQEQHCTNITPLTHQTCMIGGDAWCGFMLEFRPTNDKEKTATPLSEPTPNQTRTGDTKLEVCGLYQPKTTIPEPNEFEDEPAQDASEPVPEKPQDDSPNPIKCKVGCVFASQPRIIARYAGLNITSHPTGDYIASCTSGSCGVFKRTATGNYEAQSTFPIESSTQPHQATWSRDGKYVVYLKNILKGNFNYRISAGTLEQHKNNAAPFQMQGANPWKKAFLSHGSDHLYALTSTAFGQHVWIYKLMQPGGAPANTIPQKIGETQRATDQLAVHPTKKIFAVESFKNVGNGNPQQEYHIDLYQYDTAQNRYKILRSFINRGAKTSAMAFHPKGKFLVVSLNVMALIAIPLPFQGTNGIQMSQNVGLTAPITQIVFSPNGNRMLTIEGDGTKSSATARMWRYNPNATSDGSPYEFVNTLVNLKGSPSGKWLGLAFGSHCNEIISLAHQTPIQLWRCQ